MNSQALIILAVLVISTMPFGLSHCSKSCSDTRNDPEDGHFMTFYNQRNGIGDTSVIIDTGSGCAELPVRVECEKCSPAITYHE